MATFESLKWTEQPEEDNTIRRCEYIEARPVVGTNLNAISDIIIEIEQQGIYLLPSKAHIVFEGRLIKADDTPYADADAVTLTNNGLMYLFSQISYQLSEQPIETVNNPGQATTMLGMLQYPNDFQLARGLNRLWYKDGATTASIADNAGFAVRQDYIIKSPTTKGTFSFCVPLKHIFGFCSDYNKIVYGFKHTLRLVRRDDDEAIFRAAGVADGKVVLSKISMRIPQVRPTPVTDVNLMGAIQRKVDIPVAFRSRHCETTAVQPNITEFSWKLSASRTSERPRYVIVGFQTDKQGSQERNPAIFDHCNLKDIRVILDNDQYPQTAYNLSFPNNRFSTLYQDMTSFIENFYGVDELITDCNINPRDFKELYPLAVIDISKQEERIKSSGIDIEVVVSFNANVPAGTRAYALLISDKLMKFKSDGSRMYAEY